MVWNFIGSILCSVIFAFIMLYIATKINVKYE